MSWPRVRGWMKAAQPPSMDPPEDERAREWQVDVLIFEQVCNEFMEIPTPQVSTHSHFSFSRPLIGHCMPLQDRQSSPLTEIVSAVQGGALALNDGAGPSGASGVATAHQPGGATSVGVAAETEGQRSLLMCLIFLSSLTL